MKRILYAAAICSLSFAVSCQKEENKSIDKDFQYVIPSETILGQSVTFEDQSISVQSREWKFEDGTPATSSDAIVNVVFAKAGEKTVSLTVNYADGTKDEISKKISVKDSFSAKMKVEGLTPKGCAKKGSEVTFSLEVEAAAGVALSYAWTFPGGTPATSTEASPKVVWNGQDNDVNVTCELTRTIDGAKLNLETSLIAGNYPLLVNDKYSAFDFEGEISNKAWYGWFNSNKDDELLSVADGGANNSAHCMKIDATAMDFTKNQILQVGHRNNWSNNARLEAGKKYEFIFWLKADAYKLAEADAPKNVGELAAYLAWIQVLNNVPGYLNDPMRGSEAKTDWSDVFQGETFEEQAQVIFFSSEVSKYNATGTEDDPTPFFENLITDNWKEYRYEFTMPETIEGNRNCFCAFGFTGVLATFYLDQVQINLIEE